MDEDDSIEFQKVMLLELNERIDELNNGLLAYEKDPLNKTAYDDILRTLHGLKGLFALSGYPKLSSITHSMEDLVNSIDNNRFKKIIALLFQYSDELARFSSGLSGGKTPELLRFDQLTQGLASFDEFIVNLGSKLRIRVTFSRDCKVISARCLVLTKKLKEKATIERTIPPLEEIHAGVSFKELVIEITTQEDEATIKQIVGETQDVTSANVSRLLDSVNIVEQTSVLEDSQEALNVRVNLHDLDQIVRFLGDLVVSGQFIREIGEEHSYSRDFKENLASFERTIANIQDLVIRMRLVPLDTIVNRFPRMVRDLSKKEGKEVEFMITGKHIGVDRSVIEHLVNPLTHLLRNAVSHGIEKPEARIQKNKKSCGIIKLNVTQERSDIIIEVYDDGKGVDYEKVRRKAIDVGLIDPAEKPTKEELEMLLFSKSLSTAEVITDISGRGVGLNIVKDAISESGGAIEIESEPDEFTSIRLIIPISIAITKVLMLNVEEHQLAVPMANIDQILSVPESKIIIDSEAEKITKSIIVDSVRVPLVDLREKLHFRSSNSSNRIRSQTSYQNSVEEIVVLWRKGTRSLGFIVNELLGERDVVIKPLNNFLNEVGVFSGATVLEGGQVVLILDPMNFLEVKISE